MSMCLPLRVKRTNKMDAKLKSELAEIEEEIKNNEQEMQVILERQDMLKIQRQVLVDKLRDFGKNLKKQINLENTDFQWSLKLDNALKTVFKFDKLRPNQLQALNATLNGTDCMVIMPTGGGKSLCFQLPAVISPGFTIVVSPLLSLIEDQVIALKNIGVKAVMITSSVDRKVVNEILKEMINPGTRLKIIYVTPERCGKSKTFMAKLEKAYDLGLFTRLAVDEVHCCSQWGHDFRKDYKILGIFKRQFPKVPIIGLTATATARVTLDVQEMLNIHNCLVFRASFNRPNLFYKLLPKPVSKEVNEVLSDLIKTYKGQSGIVYCPTIKEAEEVAKQLEKCGISAMPYHAQLTAELRSKIHRLWLSNKCQVVVATIAFGMGIDKPDVRFVVHYSLTKSVENYYQESGRAGRDDKRADCIMFYRFGDLFKQSCSVFTESTGLEHLYSMAAYCIEQSRCRRLMLADHFDERWKVSDCNNMCDVCQMSSSGNSNRTLSKVDITSHCQSLYKIIEAASLSNQKLTALKLIDAWMGKRVTGFQMPKINSPKFLLPICERIIVFLLLEGYLKEHFHFTPYNTISYIIIGIKSAKVMDGTAVIEIEMKSVSPSIAIAKSNSSSIKSSPEVVDSIKSTNVSKKRKADGKTKETKPNVSLNSCSSELNESDFDFGESNSSKKDVRKKKIIKLESDSD